MLNLASKFQQKVDERFTRESFATGVCGNAYDFDGVDTIKVFNLPTVPMNDYARHAAAGVDRYGTAIDLQAGYQTMRIRKDRSFTFTIEKGDVTQRMAIESSNQALSRQINEVIIPEYDRYVFGTLAAEASAAGNFSSTTASKSTPSDAYKLFVEANEFLGDHLAPDNGRVAICSYSFANLLKLDPAFTAATAKGDEIRQKGVIGMVDGVTIKQVPSSRLPAGCGCLFSHPYASLAPEQLKDYKLHDNPPGYNGWKVEGRLIYDTFVLDQKVNGLYYVGMTGVLRTLQVSTAPDPSKYSNASRFSLVHVEPYTTGVTYYRLTNAPAAPTYGATVNSGTGTESSSATYGWNTLSANNTGVAYDSTKPWVEIVETDGSNKVIGYGRARMYVYDEYWTDTVNSSGVVTDSTKVY